MSRPISTIATMATLLALVPTVPSACGGAPEAPKDKAPAKLTLPAAGLPQRLEEIISGGAQSCRKDSECVATVCYYGRCLGLLQVDQRFSQERILAELKRVVEAQDSPELNGRLEERLAEFIGRPDADVAWRARAIHGLEIIGRSAPIAKALESTDERVQAAASLALTRMGDARGVPMAVALTESEQVHVAVEALHALGVSGKPDEALPTLLAALSDDLDRMMVRAAVQGLGDLGDPRAIRPLVSFLQQGPDHLAHRIAAVLRILSKTQLGQDSEAWAKWVADNKPPEPPKYKVRTSSDEADFGMPDF